MKACVEEYQMCEGRSSFRGPAGRRSRLRRMQRARYETQGRRQATTMGLRRPLSSIQSILPRNVLTRIY